MSCVYDPDCRRCSRLAGFLGEVSQKHPTYFCRPVPPFGDWSAGLLIVGLAPGMHGANRSGRPFTGDHAGIHLYATLFKYGLSSAAVSSSADDGLELHGVRITNAVKCLPPGNKPNPMEIRNCNSYLQDELKQSSAVRVVLALGKIAHDSVLRAGGAQPARHRFAHAAEHDLGGGRILLDSYHCSRYNTQTRRLTTPMFEAVMGRAVQLTR